MDDEWIRKDVNHQRINTFQIRSRNQNTVLHIWQNTTGFKRTKLKGRKYINNGLHTVKPFRKEKKC